jgi:hypothetical protein
MKTRTTLSLAAASASLLLAATSATAAVITWDGSVSTTTSEANVISTGLTNVAGANFGGGSPGNLVANGVTFAFVADNTTTALGNGISIDPGNWEDASSNAILSTMTGDFGTILDNQFDYDHNSASANTSVDMTLSGLVDGQQYQIQFFASLNVALSPGFGPVDFQDTSGGIKSPGLEINPGEQYVVGMFTAIGTSQIIRVNPSLNTGPLVSAFVIGSVPEPSSAALLGLGGLALILRRSRK